MFSNIKSFVGLQAHSVIYKPIQMYSYHDI